MRTLRLDPRSRLYLLSTIWLQKWVRSVAFREKIEQLSRELINFESCLSALAFNAEEKIIHIHAIFFIIRDSKMMFDAGEDYKSSFDMIFLGDQYLVDG